MTRYYTPSARFVGVPEEALPKLQELREAAAVCRKRYDVGAVDRLLRASEAVTAAIPIPAEALAGVPQSVAGADPASNAPPCDHFWTACNSGIFVCDLCGEQRMPKENEHG